MTSGCPYTFDETWRMRAAADDVFEALKDLGGYLLWWPQVRRIQRLDGAAAVVTIRSLLPVSLRIVTRQRIVDRRGLVLEATLSDELEGWSRWTLSPVRNGTVARFTEVATLRKPIPDSVQGIARPVFRMNHSAMMRSGERGLRTYLER